MRVDEQFARCALSDVLKRAGLTPTWTPGGEPPDFYLTVGQQQFGVEITQVMEIVDLGDRVMPEYGVSQALRKFATEIEANAKREGVLRGRYLLFLEPIPRMASHRERLVEATLQYFKETTSLESAEPVLLGSFQNGAMIHLQKLSSEGSAVLYMTGGADAKWGGQIVNEVSGLIRTAIDTKAAKTANLKLPMILLLVDAYIYASDEEWQVSTNWVVQHPFHTIARIHDVHQCQILFSKNEMWRSAA